MTQISKIVKATQQEMIEAFGNEPMVIQDCLEEIVVPDFEMDESTFCPTPDSEGEIDENAIMPLCSASGVSGAMYLGVNKSDSNINVRSGASTSYSIVGKLYQLECYTYTGASKSDGSYTWYQVEFRNSSGTWTSGWYRGYNGMAYWKNNPYSSVTSNDSLGGNFACKTYLVKKATKVWNTKGPTSEGYYITVSAGDIILCKSGSHGKTGSSYHSLLLCHGIRYKLSSGYKDEMFSNFDSKYSFSSGYADTLIKSTPTAPAVRGNW